MNVRQIEFGSAEHARSVDLRRRVLRWPLGLDLSAEDLEAERFEHVLIAEKDGELVGTLNLVDLEPFAVKMRQVAVEPAAQGGGIGRALVEASEVLARSLGRTEVKLHARETAVPFYLALGYTVLGEGFEEVGIPHRLMTKSLGA